MLQPKYFKYCEQRVIDDKDDVFTIIDNASERLRTSFKIKSDYPELILAIFSITYTNIIKELMSRRDRGFEKYKIIFGGRLEIGFDNAQDEEYEKNGSFMIYLSHLYPKEKNDASREYEDTSLSLCAAWNSSNITTDKTIINDIVSAALKEMKSYDISLSSIEIVKTVFMVVYDAIIQYITVRRKETGSFDFSINFASLFDVTAQESDDVDEDIIRFQPSIADKLILKSDEKASSKFDSE